MVYSLENSDQFVNSGVRWGHGWTGIHEMLTRRCARSLAIVTDDHLKLSKCAPEFWAWLVTIWRENDGMCTWFFSVPEVARCWHDATSQCCTRSFAIGEHHDAEWCRDRSEKASIMRPQAHWLSIASAEMVITVVLCDYGKNIVATAWATVERSTDSTRSHNCLTRISRQ